MQLSGELPEKSTRKAFLSFRHVLRGREAVLRRIIHEVGPVAVLVPERRCEILWATGMLTSGTFLFFLLQ